MGRASALKVRLLVCGPGAVTTLPALTWDHGLRFRCLHCGGPGALVFPVPGVAKDMYVDVPIVFDGVTYYCRACYKAGRQTGPVSAQLEFSVSCDDGRVVLEVTKDGHVSIVPASVVLRRAGYQGRSR